MAGLAMTGLVATVPAAGAAGTVTPAAVSSTVEVGAHVASVPGIATLGAPLGPEAAWRSAGGGYAQRFENGWALIGSNGYQGAVRPGSGGIVTGVVLEYLAAHGWTNAAGWPLGNATTDSSGLMQRFDSGAVMQSGNGTFLLKGGLWGYYQSAGLRGTLGAPRGEEMRWQSGGGGWAQHFSGGWLTYQSAATKGWVGSQLQPFPNLNALGWPTGGTYSACGTQKVNLKYGYATTNGVFCPDGVNVGRATTASTVARTSASSTAAGVTVPANTLVSGQISNGWLRVSTPTNLAGRFIATTALAAAYPGWSGYGPTTRIYNSAGTTVATVPADQKFYGRISEGYLVIVDGAWRGNKLLGSDVMWTDPAKPLSGTSAPSSRAAVGVTVTRYTIDTRESQARSDAAIRSQASTHSTLLGYAAPATAFVGQYVNRYWFKITSGPQAGRYITADALATSPSLSAVNGKKPAGDLCPVPAWALSAWAPNTTRYLGCSALQGFVEMNTAFKAKFGYNIRLDEGYRDLVTQNMYHLIYPYPRAAMPGTSNHGLGMAIDLEAETSAVHVGSHTHYNFGSAADQWLTANGKNYGWDRPPYLDATGNNPEYWHYNYIG